MWTIIGGDSGGVGGEGGGEDGGGGRGVSGVGFSVGGLDVVGCSSSEGLGGMGDDSPDIRAALRFFWVRGSV